MEMAVASDARPVAVVIDNDETVRNSLASLFQSVDMRVEAFGSPAEFVSKSVDDAANCVVLDVRLPGMSGLDFHRELAAANIDIPIIFITGQGGIPMAVQAMKAGAVDFLTAASRAGHA